MDLKTTISRVVAALTMAAPASAAEDQEAALASLYNEGLSHIKAANYKLALISFNKLLKIDPKYSKARAIRDKVIEKLEAREAESPARATEEEIETWYNEGNAMVELGMYAEAVESFDRALEGEPRNAVILYRKSVALTGLGRCEDAIACLKKALEVNPSFSDAWHAMSANYARLNRPDEALKCLDRVVAIDPDHVPAA